MMQRLWLCKIQWDESLPADLDTSWKRFREQLQQVNYVKITRHVLCDNPVRVEIHGFADASLEAYGACVYVRSEDANGKVYVRVMCSKTKVAPLKTITVPRLELCAALLLANLVQKVKTSLTVKIDEIVLWSDSSVCLTWIHTPPNILQTFVGNRVSQIQGLTQTNQWNHISTKDNPADLLSRGLSPELIEPCELWWCGPKWLGLSKCLWPKSVFKHVIKVPELRKQAQVFKVEIIEWFPFHRFSSFSKMISVRLVFALYK
ncbi:unnamed protein product [Acanthoscelides obtectus]|uniref:Uncharacterized protein n=1 Tax=Acanthoscelides obtectus TaxID=200917 RepID=A0A9P0M7D4_ACAOB|nr:unnamed protein product [Acanthoscelides obtectus]CAK1624177.1 hypothetical protein AOBTE_LOCUS2377 [Acanthoscelides obtectus]